MRFLSTAFLTLALGLSANATTVFYNTTGDFTGGTSTTTSDFVNFNDGLGDIAMITFDFDTSDSATSTGLSTNANFGTFVATVNNPGVTINIPATAFTLTINQTTPGGNTSPLVLHGTLTAGTLSQTSSSVDVSFATGSGTVSDTVTPGTTTYTVDNPTPITPQTTGNSTLTGTLLYTATVSTPAPEPATFAMMGGGLLVLGSIARRRRKS